MINDEAAQRHRERRHSTAAKMVFGRGELDRRRQLGSATCSAPVARCRARRGAAENIRMRGLGNGYTMTLINGEPARAASRSIRSRRARSSGSVIRAPSSSTAGDRRHDQHRARGRLQARHRGPFIDRQDQDKPGLRYAVQSGKEAFNYNVGFNFNHNGSERGDDAGMDEFALTDHQGLLAQQETTHSRSGRTQLPLRCAG